MTGKRRWMGLLGVIAMAAGISMIVAAYGVAGTRAKADMQPARTSSPARRTLHICSDHMVYLLAVFQLFGAAKSDRCFRLFFGWK